MTGEAEVRAMHRALALAANGLGATSPNPVVGAVVLDRGGAVVGEGWHGAVGGPHAEVEALRAAGDAARDGTLVVSLEPCSHTGRTPPCTAAIIDAGIRRVIAALIDPHPIAAGGAETLRAEGIDVEIGVLADEAARLNEAWLTATRLGRPFVTWKYAASLDGRTSASDGTSKWITSPAARADANRLRGEVDAVVVGVGTVFADDCWLTARDATGGLATRQPLRVVVDSHGRTPVDARVLDDVAPTWVATTARAPGVPALAARGATVVELTAGPDGRVDIRSLLDRLYSHGARHVLVEGGATLAGAFVDAGLIDRVVAYLAPSLLGGEGSPALGGRGAPTIGAARALRIDDVTAIDGDLRITARPEKAED